MPQQIWLVRHGNREDFGNPDWSRTAARPYDPALSPDGERQAQEAAQVLAGAAIHRIFASPFLRTVQTAHAAAEALDLTVALEPGIGEILPTVQEQPELLPPQVLQEHFPRLDLSHTPVGRLAYPEPEAAGLRRAANAAQALADRYANQNLLLVTHAAPVVGIVRHLADRPERISVPLCAIFVLERSDARWRLVQQADVSHLSDQSTSLRWAHYG
ncbi:MAG: histidine phosphatase family protein [Caldilineae bacterium]|nr:MAG: histidine phosphatase family protein [Caldilineae bacterium]